MKTWNLNGLPLYIGLCLQWFPAFFWGRPASLVNSQGTERAPPRNQEGINIAEDSLSKWKAKTLSLFQTLFLKWLSGSLSHHRLERQHSTLRCHLTQIIPVACCCWCCLTMGVTLFFLFPLPCIPAWPHLWVRSCVSCAVWRCHTQHRWAADHQGRRASGFPRADCSWASQPGASSAFWPAGLPHRRFSGPNSREHWTLRLFSCTRDTRVGPTSSSISGSVGRSCGCTAAKQGPRRCRSIQGRWDRPQEATLSSPRRPYLQKFRGWKIENVVLWGSSPERLFWQKHSWVCAGGPFSRKARGTATALPLFLTPRWACFPVCYICGSEIRQRKSTVFSDGVKQELKSHWPDTRLVQTGLWLLAWNVIIQATNVTAFVLTSASNGYRESVQSKCTLQITIWIVSNWCLPQLNIRNLLQVGQEDYSFPLQWDWKIKKWLIKNRTFLYLQCAADFFFFTWFQVWPWFHLQGCWNLQHNVLSFGQRDTWCSNGTFLPAGSQRELVFFIVRRI